MKQRQQQKQELQIHPGHLPFLHSGKNNHTQMTNKKPFPNISLYLSKPQNLNLTPKFHFKIQKKAQRTSQSSIQLDKILTPSINRVIDLLQTEPPSPHQRYIKKFPIDIFSKPRNSINIPATASPRTSVLKKKTSDDSYFKFRATAYQFSKELTEKHKRSLVKGCEESEIEQLQEYQSLKFNKLMSYNLNQIIESAQQKMLRRSDFGDAQLKPQRQVRFEL